MEWLCSTRYWIGAVLIVGLAGSVAAADVQHLKIHVTVQQGEKVQQEQTVDIYFQGKNLHIKTECTQPEQCADMIYQSDQKTLYIIQHGRKIVMRITREDVDQLAQMLAPFIEQMRKMQEQQKARKGQSAANGGDWTFKKGKTGMKHGQYTCTEYTILRGNQKVGTACIAAYADVGLSRETFYGILQEIASMMEPFTRMMQGMDTREDQPPSPLSAIMQGKQPPYDGVPVYQKVTLQGGRVTTSELVSTDTTAPEDFLQLPKDYRVVSFAEALGNMMGGKPPGRQQQ